MKIKNFQIKKQNISKILIGSNNKGKIKEIRDLIPNKVKILGTRDFNLKSPKENGKTFEENSEIKANFFCEKSNLVTLSDDSGLEVDCLNGEPGIFSSRWADELGGFQNAMIKILDKVKKLNKSTNAQFVSSLTIRWPDGKKITETGTIKGDITNIKGKNGFGYDPIFIPKGFSKTFAEMNYIEKLKIDHRQVAYQKLFKKIKAYF